MIIRPIGPERRSTSLSPFCHPKTNDYPSSKVCLLDSDGLGQVPREIDVKTLSNGQPVSHELQRDDVEETLEEVVGVGDLDLVGLLARELLVVGVADDDGAALAGDDLLVGVEGLGEDVIAGQDHDDRQVLVDEGEDTVLQLARHDGLAVEVGNFFDLEGAWEV